MRDIPIEEIPDRELIASFYVHGNIDEGAVYQRERDGKIIFLGAGHTADVYWNESLGFWVIDWDSSGYYAPYGVTGKARLMPYGQDPVPIMDWDLSDVSA